MKKFEQLWIMPPLYHRVYDFLTRTTVQSRQEYSYQAIARFVGWYDDEEWDQPTAEQVEKILKWLHKNEFIIMEKGEGQANITIVWSQARMSKPMTEVEYHNTYMEIFSDNYKAVAGSHHQITNRDIQAIHELSQTNVSIKQASEIMNRLVDKKHKSPSISYIKDYVFADMCFEIACGY